MQSNLTSKKVCDLLLGNVQIEDEQSYTTYYTTKIAAANFALSSYGELAIYSLFHFLK